jgi:hypothetical protein
MAIGHFGKRLQVALDQQDDLAADQLVFHISQDTTKRVRDPTVSITP